MNFDEIKQLLDMVREHELAEFELERENFKIRVRKNVSGPPAVAVTQASPGQGGGAARVAATAAGPGSDEPLSPALLSPAGEDAAEVDLAVVKSPIVGTFYRAPDPESPAFAEVGSLVRKGQVLCIIEAMKLMNEINSDVDGEVVKVFVENGQPVQDGERLFALKLRNV